MALVDRKSFRVGALALTLLVVGCQKEPSRWDAAQSATHVDKLKAALDAFSD